MGAAVWILRMDWRLALLLGAVLVVTGPTVVAPMLRHIRPNKKVSAIVKWEGIVIDPIGAILAVLVYENFFHGGAHFIGWATLRILGWTLATAVLLSGIALLTIVQLIQRFLVPEYLQGVVFLCGGSGLCNLESGCRRSGFGFGNAAGYCICQSEVDPDRSRHRVQGKLGSVSGFELIHRARFPTATEQDRGVGVAGGLFFGSGCRHRPSHFGFFGVDSFGHAGARASIPGLFGARGIVAAAVTSVFALRISQFGESVIPASQIDQLVPVTFTVIIGSVAIYGLGAAPLARRLGLADSNPQGVLFVGAEPWIRDVAATMQKTGVTVAVVDTNFANISAAKMDGLSAFCLSILSEHVHDDVDFAGIGRLLAVTHNDLVNTLAAKTFAHFFGRKNVYQILPATKTRGRRVDMSQSDRGRTLFAADISDRVLEAYFEAGYRCKATKLSDEFTYEQFQAKYSDGCLLLAVLDGNSLQFATSDRPLKPVPGNTVFACVLESADES